jgi:hypothetical protein
VKGLVHGVAQDALRQPPGDPGKTLGRAVVDREDEAKVDRVPEAAAVIHQGPPDCLLVATECAVPLPDAVQLAAFSPAQTFLAVENRLPVVKQDFEGTPHLNPTAD